MRWRAAPIPAGCQECRHESGPALSRRRQLPSTLARPRRRSAATRTPRPACTGDSHAVGNGLLGSSDARKTVSTAKNASLIERKSKTVAYVSMLGCAAAKANFFLVGDSTHFQQNGARIMAGFVADGVVTLGLPLAGYRLP